MILTIEQDIANWSGMMEHHLNEVFPPSWNIPEQLRESMNYSIRAGGKRLRPILTLAACEACGGKIEDAIPAACAVELIHTYSLIHDDLPAMDDDDLRRGKPTNHIVYGDATAILAGDALLTHAFYLLSLPSVVPARRTLRMIYELSVFSGARGMVGGQAADIEGEQGISSWSQLAYIHEHKTADLLVASLRLGGHAANASDDLLDELEQFGHALGMAFQIQDDILDLEGDQAIIGKPIGSDERSGKATAPRLLGRDEAGELLKRYTNQAIGALAHPDFAEVQRLQQLAVWLMNRDR